MGQTNINSTYSEKFVDYGEITERKLKLITYATPNLSFTFYGSSLKKIKLPYGILSIPQNAFNGCQNITSIGPVGSGADVEIPNSVTSIGNNAFHGCTGLTSVTIPNSVTTIDIGAFRGCTSLTSITIPNSVTTIGNSAFEDCAGITNIEIPNSVIEINTKAFAGCTSLENITINNNNTTIAEDSFEGSTDNLPSEGNIVYIGNVAYCLKNPSSTQTTYTIKNGTTTLNNGLFKDNTYVTTVTTPNSLLTVGYSCFYNCTNLTDVTLNNGLIEIGYSAFGKCSSLVSLTLPNTLTTLGNGVFAYCSSLTEMQIPDSVIGTLNNTFIKCTSLRDLIIGDGITHLSFLFEDTETVSNYVLQNLVLGKNINRVYLLFGNKGYSAEKTFTNVTVNCFCTDWQWPGFKATNLKIGKDFPSVTKLNNYVANALTTIGINSNLSVDPQNPYYFAYNNCLFTTDTNTLVFAKNGEGHDIHSQNTITTIGQGTNIFRNTEKYSRTFVLPESITTIKANAFKEAYLTSLIIPTSVTKIESYALQDAVRVNSVYSSYTLQFKSLVPPTIQDFALDCANDNPFSITVPAAAYNTYRNAWSRYGTRIVPDDYSQLQQQWVDLYECCVNGELRMKQKRQLSSNGITWYDSYVNNVLDIRFNETVLGTCEQSIDLSLGSFQTSTSYGNLASANYDFYESTMASNVTGSNSMSITLYGYESFTFKIRTNRVNYYNFIYVNNLDDISYMNNNTYGPPSVGDGTAAGNKVYAYTNTSSTSEWTNVTFNNLDGGEHTIKIVYKKKNTGADNGYVAIPKVQP